MRRPTTEEAKRVGDAIGVDSTPFDLEQFRAGMDVELEHGSHLERIEREAERDRAEKS
jgi:hypothetical protein